MFAVRFALLCLFKKLTRQISEICRAANASAHKNGGRRLPAREKRKKNVFLVLLDLTCPDCVCVCVRRDFWYLIWGWCRCAETCRVPCSSDVFNKMVCVFDLLLPFRPMNVPYEVRFPFSFLPPKGFYTEWCRVFRSQKASNYVFLPCITRRRGESKRKRRGERG